MPKMKPIAVEAFGRHLKGTDASVPFSFGSFFGNSGKPKDGIWSIPFLYPLDGSVGYRFRSARPIVQGKAQIAKGEKNSPAGTGLSTRSYLRCPRSESLTA